MSNIIYVIDTETTGMDHITCDVVELSMARFELHDPESVEQKTWLAKALNPSAIEEKALEVNGHKREDVLCLTKFGKENYKMPDEVISEVESWVMDDNRSIDNRIVVGQNPEFDMLFLKEFWRKGGSPDTFPFSSGRNSTAIDTIMIARLIDLCTGTPRKYYNLSSLVKDFGISKKQAHTAAGDVGMTKDLFVKMLVPLLKTIVEVHASNYQK